MKLFRSLILTIALVSILTATAFAVDSSSVDSEKTSPLPEAVTKLDDDEENPFEVHNVYSPEVDRLVAKVAVFGVVCLVLAISGFLIMKVYQVEHPDYLDENDIDDCDYYDYNA